MSPDAKEAPNPTYKQVCSKQTGYVEVLHLKFDKRKTTFEEIAKFLFTFHDPTTFQKQGNDKGPQYASTIFYHNEKQKDIADEVINKV